MRRRKVSRVLGVAEARLAGLRAIKADLDLGHGVGVKTLSAATSQLSVAVGKYNEVVAEVEDARVEVERLEAVASDLSQRALAMVSGRYGRDSSEYAQVGGVRKSDRKRPRRAAAPAKSKAGAAATDEPSSGSPDPAAPANGAARPAARS